MKIHLPTSTVLYNEKQAYLKYRELSGNKAEPVETLDWAAWDIFPFAYSTYDSTTHVQTSNAVSDGSGGYTFEVRPKTQSELDADRDAHIQQMEQAVVNYIETKGGQNKGRIHFTAAPMVDSKAAQGKVKNKACSDWVMSVWGLYYQRLNTLEQGGAWDDSLLDFSGCSEMPYTIHECLVEE